MDKHHPYGHAAPSSKNGLPCTPVAIPERSQQPRAMGRGSSARPPEQLSAMSAPIPHLGLYWREGELSSLFFIQVATELGELRLKIK